MRSGEIPAFWTFAVAVAFAFALAFLIASENPVILSEARSAQPKDPDGLNLTNTLTPFSPQNPTPRHRAEPSN
jgi:hypothetical protein